MPEVDVAVWKRDPASVILRLGPYSTVETAGYIRQDRAWLEEMRSPGAELSFGWLQSRNSQLAAFFLTLSRFYGHRELLMDKHQIDYLGEEL